MNRQPESPGRLIGTLWFPAVGVFFLSFAYAWFRLQAAALFWEKSLVFAWGWPLFRQDLSRPGGLFDYATAITIQGMRANWIGSIILGLLAALLFVVTEAIWARLVRKVRLAGLLAPWLLLVSLNRYDGVALGLGLKLLASLALTLVCIKARFRPKIIQIAAAICVAGALYYAGGLWPALVMLLAFAGVLALELLWPSVPALEPQKEKKTFRKRASHPDRGALAANLRWAAVPAILLGLGGPVVWLTLNTQARALAEIDYYASKSDYQAVLKATSELNKRRMTPAAEVRLHWALFHQEGLCEDLFSYQNQPAWQLLPGLTAGLDSCRAESQVFLELGLVNDAEHMAHEALEWDGERPEILKVLAQVNVLKNRPAAARVFLNRLNLIPGQSLWAEKRLRDLETDPACSGDRELAAIRARMIRTDRPHSIVPLEGFLIQLLHDDPQNRMAYEYLMAYYLLTKDLPHLVPLLAHLGDFKYKTVPRHCEEAVLLYALNTDEKVNLCGLEIRPETIQRYQRFRDALQRGAHRTEAGREELNRDFGDTFWHYYHTTAGSGMPIDRSRSQAQL